MHSERIQWAWTPAGRSLGVGGILEATYLKMHCSAPTTLLHSSIPLSLQQTLLQGPPHGQTPARPCLSDMNVAWLQELRSRHAHRHTTEHHEPTSGSFPNRLGPKSGLLCESTTWPWAHCFNSQTEIIIPVLPSYCNKCIKVPHTQQILNRWWITLLILLLY